MSADADRRPPRAAPDAAEQHRLAEALVALGEPRAAVDLMRRELNFARAASEEPSRELLRLLGYYAGILESTDALAEAEYVRVEALDIVNALALDDRDAVDAYLRHGMLLVRIGNYSAALTQLREAVRRADALEDVGALEQQIILAQAWRAQAQALEELGEFSEASDALDTLVNVKRQTRVLVWSPRRRN
ncbi:MAG: hypothetical protein JOZ24_13505 [Candidatus Eremiobacteraeota bacterium]|nr:hypothetical protein [Candidatus Eremiobacteraeota bacterium]